MSFEQYRPSRFSMMPAVTKNIIIINAIMYLATVMMGGTGIDLNDLLGLHYFQSEKFHAWQFITYMFMHGNFGHIFFNMFAVWMFGTAIENIWGAKRFLNYYILTGLGAAVTHYALVYYELQPALAQINDMLANSALTESQLLEIAEQRTALLDGPVVIGASGAVFGLLLAYGMTFPNNYVYIYFAIPIKAKYFVVLYGLLELFAGVARYQGDNVAHFAHLGGLLCGFIIIQLWRHNDHNYF